MIKEIIMKNIKGQVTNQPLTGRDIICGTNGAGKTTRAQAVGISLLGYVPGNGKLPAETYKLCSDSAMTVGLITDKFEYTRCFSKKATRKNGITEITITQELEVSPEGGERNKTQKEARILSEVGNLPVMLDFNEFLSLSDAKRREFFYNLAAINPNEWSKKGVLRKLQDAVFTDDVRINSPEIWCMLDDKISNAMEQYTSEDIQLSIQIMLDYSKARLSHWRDEKEKAEAAGQKISEYKNELQTTDRNLEKNKAELERLQAELINISNIIAVYDEKQKAEAERLTRIELLRREISKIQDETAPGNEQSIQEDIKNYLSDMEKVDNSKRIQAGRKCVADLKEQIAVSEEAIRLHNKDISQAMGNVTAHQKLLDMIAQNHGCCVIDPRITCKNDFIDFINAANVEIDKSNAVISNKNGDIKSAEETISQNNFKIVKYEQVINQLIDEERIATKNNDDIRNIISQLRNTLADITNFVSVKSEKIKVRQNEIERLEATTSEIKDISAEISQKVELEEKIRNLKQLIDEQNKTRIRLLDLKNSVIDAKEAEREVECWKLISKALGSSGIQGEIVKSIMNPIKSAIQEKLDAMDIHNEFFFETSSDKGKEVFQFGWLNSSDDKRNFDALSTGEQMILLIALITTIIERNNPPLKVLMIDNIENLDKDNFSRVIKGMDKVAKGLDNVIFLGVIEPDPADCPGWTVWNLSREDKAVAV